SLAVVRHCLHSTHASGQVSEPHSSFAKRAGHVSHSWHRPSTHGRHASAHIVKHVATSWAQVPATRLIGSLTWQSLSSRASAPAAIAGEAASAQSNATNGKRDDISRGLAQVPTPRIKSE